MTKQSNKAAAFAARMKPELPAAHPSAEWIAWQLTEACDWEITPAKHTRRRSGNFLARSPAAKRVETPFSMSRNENPVLHHFWQF